MEGSLKQRFDFQMKTMTADEAAVWQTLPIEERVAMKAALWEVGDPVAFFKDGVDLEGKIKSIETDAQTGRPKALIETRWGDFTSPLSLCSVPEANG